MNNKSIVLLVGRRALILAGIMALLSCGENVDPPTLEEQQALVIEDLSDGSWGLTDISRSGTDASSVFDKFELSFGDGTYSTANGKHVWKDAGTWMFVQGKTDQIIRDDDVVIDLIIEDDKLTLSFELEENVYSTGGRQETVITQFLFNLFRR